jgi:hypothetical protein
LFVKEERAQQEPPLLMVPTAGRSAFLKLREHLCLLFVGRASAQGFTVHYVHKVGIVYLLSILSP